MTTLNFSPGTWFCQPFFADMDSEHP